MPAEDLPEGLQAFGPFQGIQELGLLLKLVVHELRQGGDAVALVAVDMVIVPGEAEIDQPSVETLGVIDPDGSLSPCCGLCGCTGGFTGRWWRRIIRRNCSCCLPCHLLLPLGVIRPDNRSRVPYRS